METLLQNQKRADLERSTLTKLKKEEQAKRLSGKGAWFLKEADKKRAVLKAQFEVMGRGEARKAMERRQKRIAQKEKKARPWTKGSGRPAQALVERKRKGSELAGEERKRRRVG
jgi:ribosomal RNA-processing protein 36